MIRNPPGNPKIGITRKQLQSEHRQEVYEAVHHLGSKVKVNDIRKYLNDRTRERYKKIEVNAQAIYESGLYKWTNHDRDKRIKNEKGKVKKTISERTIERCIKNDSRIKKEGWYYFIDDETRFEKRHLSPREFGLAAYRRFMDYIPSGKTETERLEFEMKEMIARLGAFLVFMFIEASRPFEDKSMNIDDRGQLVKYWVRNSIPIDVMYEDFLSTFDRRHESITKLEPKEAQKQMAIYLTLKEMDADSIQNTVGIISKTHPDLYRQFSQFIAEQGWWKVHEGYVIDASAPHSHWVRGKAYRKHFPPNWKDWLE